MEWISVKDSLPFPEIEVLVCYQYEIEYGSKKVVHRGITKGMHEDGNVLEDNSHYFWQDTSDFDWDEYERSPIIPEGWFEICDFNYDEDEGTFGGRIGCEVTHWMPLPELPEEE